MSFEFQLGGWQWSKFSEELLFERYVNLLRTQVFQHIRSSEWTKLLPIILCKGFS